MDTSLPASLLERFNVSRESKSRLETYVSLLLAWQQRINLIGSSTAPQIWERHIADTLQLISLLPPETRVIADLGSGAGIPGLILAIATGHHVRLYESNGKKCAFLREAIRQTQAPAAVYQNRIEDIGPAMNEPPADVVVARAFAPLDRLLQYARPFLDRGAVGLFHKGQDIELELTRATKYWKLTAKTHPSAIDSKGVILEVTEAHRVES